VPTLHRCAHVLGFEAVSGRAEVFKSGGRVMKNVTGFDLSKLMTGSFGTLGVVTTATLKVLPRPEKTRTVLLIGAETPTALRAMTAALNSPHEVSGAAHLTADQAKATGVERVAGAGRAVTAVRVEGPESSVTARAEALTALLGAEGPVDELHTANSLSFWKAVRDVAPFCGTGADDVVWRLSVPPADGADVAQRLRAATGGETLMDWGGGLLWHRLEARAFDDGGHGAVRGALGRGGGQAMLVKASADVRAAVPVFQPEDPGLETVSRRIKATFDPEGVLNPGRMLPVETA
jgi:glycolate oxidase FAD binding subunit